MRAATLCAERQRKAKAHGRGRGVESASLSALALTRDALVSERAQSQAIHQGSSMRRGRKGWSVGRQRQRETHGAAEGGRATKRRAWAQWERF